MGIENIRYAFFMSWGIFLCISVITFAFSTILQRVLLKSNQTSSNAFAIFFQLLTGIVLLIFALVHGFSLAHANILLLNIGISVILWALMNICIFRSLAKIEASEFIILFATRAFWVILAAVFFLKESFSFVQLIGTLLLISSILVISLQKNKFQLNKGTFFALGAAVCYGFAFTNDAYIVRTVDVLSYQALSFLLSGLCIFLFYPKTSKQMNQLLTKNIMIKLMTVSVLYAISVTTILVAYQMGRNAAQLGALAQTTTIVTVLFSIIFLKETAQLGKKLFSMLLAFIGVLLIG